MRHRSVWQRALIAFWGLWLVTALCEPVELQACPMHDHGAMAGMDMGSAAQASPNAAPATDEHRSAAAVCTCLGMCFGGTSVSAPEPLFALGIPAAARSAAAPHVSSAARRAAREHALPFATAPPAAATLI